MDRRTSLHEEFVRVKTLMGLEPLEVQFFIWKKSTKMYLTLKRVIENLPIFVYRLSMMFPRTWKIKFSFVKILMRTLIDWKFFKIVQSLFMMFLTISRKNFLVVKSLMGTTVDWKIFTRNVTVPSPWRNPNKYLLQYD